MSAEGRELQARFAKYVEKALHCEKCALAYEKKRVVATGKCCAEHLMGMLQERYPDFQARFSEAEVVGMAQEQLGHYQERIATYTAKQEECAEACAKFMRKARQLIPLINAA